MKTLTFIEAMDKIKKAYHKRCVVLIQEFDVSYIDFALIMFLANNKDKHTAKEFCAIRNVKPNVVSIHVDKLTSKGYLEREVDQQDRRKVNLFVTSKCDNIINKGKALQKDFYSKLTEGLTEEDILLFRKNLSIILNNANNL